MRRVLAVALCLGVLVLAAGALRSALVAARPEVPTHSGPTVHVVQPGESLWSIAHAERPSSDIASLVDKLIRLNGGSTLQVGQQLVIAD